MRAVLNKLKKGLKGKIVLLGIGNALRGDDAFGSVLARRLEGKVCFKVLDVGTTPENFLGSVVKERPDAVLVVDAVDFGAVPGEIRLLSPEAIKTGNLFATHNISISMLFRFIKEGISRGTEHRAPTIYLLAIQPKDIAFGETMSPELEGRLKELEDWLKLI